MQLAEQGVYQGKVLFHSLTESNSGTPGIELRVRYTQRENEATGEFEVLDTPITRNITLWLSKGAIEITQQNLDYLGYKDRSLARLSRTHPNAYSFTGTTVFGKCTHEEYKDKLQEKWNLQRRKSSLAPEREEALLAKVEEDFALAASAGDGANYETDGKF